jgi:hypothetical protein
MGKGRQRLGRPRRANFGSPAIAHCANWERLNVRFAPAATRKRDFDKGPSWANRVTFSARRCLPVFPNSGHPKGHSACCKSARKRTKSRAHPPWPTRGEGWGQHAVARSRNVRRRLGRPRCAGELVVEARRNDRPRARPPTRRSRPPAGPGLADVHHPGQARQASVMAMHRQPSASTRCSECDAGSAGAHGKCIDRPWNVRARAVF